MLDPRRPDRVVPDTPCPSGKGPVNVPEGSRPEVELLLDAARVCLEGEDLARFRGRIHPDLDWVWLLRMARRQGVTPLLHRHLNAVGPGDVPPDVLNQLRQSLLENNLSNLFKTGELLKILALFDAHGIAVVPYKGPTLAALAYGNFALRMFDDLDMLLHERDIPQAKDLLIRQGFRPRYALTPAQEAASLRSTRELHLVSADGLLVELHAGVSYRSFGFPIDPQRLWERREPVALLGREVLTFSAEDLLLILCVHGAKHCWVSLGWVCDISELLRSLGQRIKWDVVAGQARELHVERLLGLGLALAEGLLQAPIPQGLSASIRTDPVIPLLVAQVRRWLFRETDHLPGGLERARFLIHARERSRDGLRYGLSRAIRPEIADWEFLHLPSYLSFLYPIIRVFRIVREYELRWFTGRRRS
jgi:Uncharacterised nucleotidyltransferase